jgi:N12 class adenine-specific DNA methylase
MATPGSSYTALATNALDLIEQGLRAAVEAFPRGS